MSVDNTGVSSSVKTKAQRSRIRSFIPSRWMSSMRQQLLCGAQHELTTQFVSPVPHLHLCNDVPTDDEEAMIRRALEKLERQRNRLWRDVKSRRDGGHAEITISPELKFIEESKSQLEAVLSPVRSLPTEILVTIFMCGIEGQEVGEFSHDFKRHSRPTVPSTWLLSLLQVCRRWRLVCFSLHRVWSYLPALNHLHATHNAESNYFLYKWMIGLTGRAPLNLVVEELRHPLTPSVGSVFHDIILPECRRWEDVALTLDWPVYEDFIYARRRELIGLKRLQLIFYREPILSISPYTTPFTSDDRFLGLVDLVVHFLVPLIAPFGDPIVTISLCHLIDSCPNLRSLDLSIPLFHPLPSTIHLSCLKALKLNFSTTRYESPRETLYSFVVPELEFLVASHNGSSVDHITDALTSVIKNSTGSSPSKHPLKELHLRFMTRCVSPMSSVHIALIDLLPNLRVLSIRPTLPLLERLASPTRGSILAPNLEFCTFTIQWIEPVSIYQALSDFAKTRCCPRFAMDEPGSAWRGFRSVKALSIRCYRFLQLQEHQRMLDAAEAHNNVLDYDAATVGSTLSPLPFRLDDIVPRDISSSSVSVNMKKLNWWSASCLLKALTDDKQDHDVDIKDIYIPQVHVQLQVLDRWLDSNISQVKWAGALSVLSELQIVIRNTLEEWYFLLDEHTSKIHWVAVSPTVLMYVHPEDPIRNTSESINLARVEDMPSNWSPFYELYLQGTILNKDDEYY